MNHTILSGCCLENRGRTVMGKWFRDRDHTASPVAMQLAMSGSDMEAVLLAVAGTRLSN